ncbi:MAG TPA: glutathione transferase GstA [Verrucomicrobiae bacterium]|jgi:glutathione S-transferase|nr:glutathione transferase GstA [Verrucomicrobiae bacterium]
MKLYISPGACSLSPHIALREAGIPFDMETVDLGAKRTKSGKDFKAINPKGYVPVLELEGGQVLTEGPSIVQYIADQKPASKLAPPAGTMDRYRLQEWLNFVTSEMHKAYSPLFNPQTPDAFKEMSRTKIGGRLDFLSKSLQGKDYLMGSTFTVADAYLFVVLGWSGHVGVDLAKWPVLQAYWDRVAARPAVKAALEAEAKAK